MKLITPLLSFALLGTQAVVPLAIKVQHHLSIDSSINEQEESRILNLDDSIRQALYFAYQDENPGSNVSSVSFSKSVVHKNPSGSIKGEVQSTDIPNATYFGVSIFENGFDIPQTFLTPEFQKTVTDTFSSSVKIGINNSTKLDFGFLGQTYKFDYSSTETNTNKVKSKHTSPSMKVVVQPHKKTKVTIFLSATEKKANVLLNEDVAGTVDALITDQYGTHKYNAKLGHVFKAMEKKGILPQEITVKSDSEIHFTGLGEISSFASATQFSAVEDDITGE